MPGYPELIPPSMETRQFPGGDIDKEAVGRANALFSEVFAGTRDEQVFNVNNLIRTAKSRLGQAHMGAAVYDNLRGLEQAWGDTLTAEKLSIPGDGEPSDIGRLFTSGLLATQGFICETRMPIVARYNGKFAEDLTEMAGKNGFAIKTFAEEAWHGMNRSHPNVYASC